MLPQPMKSRTCTPTSVPSIALLIQHFVILCITCAFVGVPLSAAGVASLAVGSGSTVPGGTATLNLQMSSSGAAQPAAIQWVISYPVQDVTAISLTASTAASDAGKQLSCLAGTTAGTLNCILVGLNQSAIPAGTVATLAVQASVSPTSTSIPIAVSAVTISDADGNHIDLSPLPAGGSIALSLPIVQLGSLACTPSSVNAPGNSTCTVTLGGAAPIGGVLVSLGSSRVEVQVPANVTVPSGLTSKTFTATVGSIAANLSAVVTATAGGASRTFTLSAVAPAALSTLACTPSALLPGQTTTCTVTLSKAATSTFAVTLASSNATALPVPASVSVSAGASTANFTAKAGAGASNQSATVTATAGGVSKTSAVTVGTLPAVSGLSCSPATVNAPGTASCTVTLSAAAPTGGVAVALTSNNAKAPVPSANVSVAAAATTASFTVTAAAVTTNETAVITATANGGSKSFSLTLAAPAALSTLACTPSALLPGQTTTCTVTLSKAATSTFAVTLASSNATALPVPASVSVPAGASTANFTAKAGTGISNQSATVTATAGGVSKTTSITVGVSAQLLSVVCSPSTVTGPGHAICTLNFSSETPAGGVPTTLTSVNVNVTSPGAFTVPAGVTSASVKVSVKSVIATHTAILTATANGVVKTASLTLNPAGALPKIVLLRPIIMEAYITSRSSSTLSGTATPSAGATLTQVTWSNNRGGSGTATGTKSWSVPSVPLVSGDNIVTIQAADSLGRIGSYSVLFKRNTTPVVTTKTGILRSGAFYLEDGNGSWEGPAQDVVAMFGVPGDIAVLGDWDGTGSLAIGVFRRGEWFLDLNRNGVWDGPSIDRQGTFGSSGDVPIVGDWDGAGRTRIGVFRGGTWLLDVNGNMNWDAELDWSWSFGAAGDKPIVGDWDGSGRTKTGVFRHGLWLLDLNGNGTWDGPSVDRSGTFGTQGDTPLIGDWTGEGSQRAGVYRGGTFYLDLNADLLFDPASDTTAAFGGQPGDVPVVGDWVGDRVTRIGLFRSGTWMLDLDGDGRWDPVKDRTTYLGQTGDQPITGEWLTQSSISTVSAASFQAAPVVPGSLASVLGAGLSDTTASASETPLPTELSRVSIAFTDASGRRHPAALLFVSPAQVNYVVPFSLPLGDATMELTRPSGTPLRLNTKVVAIHPGLFSLNRLGLAAATVLRVSGAGQMNEDVYWVDGAGAVASRPLDLGPPGDELYLTLYGTGFQSANAGNTSVTVGGESAEVLYAGPQLTFPGLDQINIRLPRTLAGRGEVEVRVLIGGQEANVVRLNIK